jgi:hypothetical protein
MPALAVVGWKKKGERITIKSIVGKAAVVADILISAGWLLAQKE